MVTRFPWQQEANVKKVLLEQLLLKKQYSPQKPQTIPEYKQPNLLLHPHHLQKAQQLVQKVHKNAQHNTGNEVSSTSMQQSSQTGATRTNLNINSASQKAPTSHQ